MQTHPISQDRLIEIVRSRVARISTGQTAVRSYPAETGEKARLYFSKHLPLGDFACTTEAGFLAHLDRETNLLMRRLPPLENGSLWGISRKLLNIFLRDCEHTHHLRDHYRLHNLSPFLEIPLDRICMTRIRDWAQKNHRALPQVFSIKELDANSAVRFQKVAAEIASEMGMDRIHLDALWWADARERNS